MACPGETRVTGEMLSGDATQDVLVLVLNQVVSEVETEDDQSRHEVVLVLVLSLLVLSPREVLLLVLSPQEEVLHTQSQADQQEVLHTQSQADQQEVLHTQSQADQQEVLHTQSQADQQEVVLVDMVESFK
jgi:hypothetical protein